MSKEEKRNRDEEKLAQLGDSLKEEGVDRGIVNKHSGKPGLDMEEGKYRVLGAVSPNPIATRKGPETNIAKACGYHIEEIATGRKLKMTKKEGVNLAAMFGMRNAYIIYRQRPQKDKEGNVIKNNVSIYLQPFPAQQESFTKDDRLVSVYRLDENGKIEHPLELMIKEEDCTKDFWVYIKEMYEKKKKKQGRENRKQEAEAKRRQRILKLEAEIGNADIKNPFDFN